MTGRTLQIESNKTGTFNGYLALPRGGSGPGLILGQEIFGVNPYMKRMADRFAEEGYVTLVPDLFWRLEPGVELGYGEADRQRAFALYERFDLGQAVRDIGTAVATLRALPECGGQVGFLGYCLGGSLAYLSAARLEIDVAVGYYGVGIENFLDEAQNIRCPLLLHLGGKDNYTPPAVVEQIATAFNRHASLRYHLYPDADHGFAADERESFNAPATAIAYSRTLAVLRAAMGPTYDLEAIWDYHLACEFSIKDDGRALETMVERPYVNHIPTMTGGTGRKDLQRFYKNHFIPCNPPDTHMIPISRTVGVDKIVDEFLFCFTHTQELDWLIPGVAPSGNKVQLPMIALVNFRGDKICHEHIYWDQASALVQVGVLKPDGLPVAGLATADKMRNEELPSNQMIRAWR